MLLPISDVVQTYSNLLWPPKCLSWQVCNS